jgi:hypothetical protein
MWRKKWRVQYNDGQSPGGSARVGKRKAEKSKRARKKMLIEIDGRKEERKE